MASFRFRETYLLHIKLFLHSWQFAHKSAFLVRGPLANNVECEVALHDDIDRLIRFDG